MGITSSINWLHIVSTWKSNMWGKSISQFSMLQNLLYLVLALPQLINKRCTPFWVFPSIETIQFCGHCIKLLICIVKLGQQWCIMFLLENGKEMVTLKQVLVGAQNPRLKNLWFVKPLPKWIHFKTDTILWGTLTLNSLFCARGWFLGLVQIHHLTALQLSFSRPKTERNKEKQTDATNHDGDSLSLVENVNLSESSSLKNTGLITLLHFALSSWFDTKEDYRYSRGEKLEHLGGHW